MFENILSRKIVWYDDVEISCEARNFIVRLLCMNVEDRLGANGANEVKSHPFFEGVNWETILNEPADFVPQPKDMEDTDGRGAQTAQFNDLEELVPTEETVKTEGTCNKNHVGLETGDLGEGKLKDQEDVDDFGTFVYKNLPVLEKANLDIIRRLRDLGGLNSDNGSGKTRQMLIPARSQRPRIGSMSEVRPSNGSPTLSTSSISSGSQIGPSSPLSPVSQGDNYDSRSGESQTPLSYVKHVVKEKHRRNSLQHD